MLLITCGVCDLRCKLRADVLSPGAPRRFGAELKTLVMHLKKRYCLHNNVIIHIFIKVQNRSVSMGFNYAYQVVLPGQPGFLSMLPVGGGGGGGKGKETALGNTVPPSVSHAVTVLSSGSSGAICSISKCHFLSHTPQLGMQQPAGCFAVYLFILSAS